MRKLTLLLFSLFLLGIASEAQTTTVKGLLMDTTNKKPVVNAVVSLLTPKDSIFHKFTRSGADGSFSIKNVKPGKYIMMVTQPLFADYVDDITVTAPETNVGKISATPKSLLMQEVIVKAGGSMRIKGDTVSYTADSFKVSANANVEELLKKLPGIQVDRNGQIKAMGEVVEKVLVDGEEFFGDDPGMAVKNLRADAVKEVQVFDKKRPGRIYGYR
jgi:Na+-transporting NADH:ubiquinone oxidoreductase subunit NqrA